MSEPVPDKRAIEIRLAYMGGLEITKSSIETLRKRVADRDAEIASLKSSIGRVEALLPGWFAEPSDCGEHRTCNVEANGCGASSCFATELKDALLGSSDWRTTIIDGVRYE